MLEVELEVAETATKPWLVPLRKNSPGGCTIDRALSNCRRWQGISFRSAISCCVCFSDNLSRYRDSVIQFSTVVASH